MARERLASHWSGGSCRRFRQRSRLALDGEQRDQENELNVMNIKKLTGLLIVAWVALVAGCKKSAPPPAAAPGQIELVKLQQAFPAPGPDVQKNLEQVVFGV